MPTPDAALRTSGEGGFRFAIRPARPDDAKALWLVHGRAVRALAGTHYTPDEREAWATRMRPEGYLEPMATRLLLVAATTAEEGSRIIGYGQLHVAEGTIDAIYVDPGWVRRGVGAALVDALERESRTRILPGSSWKRRSIRCPSTRPWATLPRASTSTRSRRAWASRSW